MYRLLDEIARSLSVRLRNIVGPTLYRSVKWRYFGALASWRRLLIHANRDQCTSKTVFHFCAQKTGSRWVRDVFIDDELFKHTGLIYHPVMEFSENVLSEYDLNRILYAPESSYVGPLYYGPDQFRSLISRNDVSIFFVGRDPVDLVSSYYESMAFSHPSTPLVDKFRTDLAASTGRARFDLCVEMMKEQKTIENLIAWKHVASQHENVAYINFTSLVGPEQVRIFMGLLNLPSCKENAIKDVLDKYSFENMKARDQKIRRGEAAGHYNQGLSRKVDEHDKRQIMEVLDDVYGLKWRELSKDVKRY